MPTTSSTDGGYLTIDDVTDEEAGQYRCTATTVYSIAADDATLTVSQAPRGRPPQPVIDPPHITVNEHEPASFRCWVPGIPDCQITWHKEHIGGPLPHGVYQTGNALKIPRAQLHDAGNYICTAINQYGIGQSPNARLDVVRPAQRPRVDPIEQTVNEEEPARFRCWVPGNQNVELKWHRLGHQPLPPSVQENQGILHIPRTTAHEAGKYVCSATDPRDNRPQDSDPVTLNLREPAHHPQQAPQVDPPEQTVNEGDPAQFRCWVPGNPQAQLKWRKQNGEPLPEGTLERDGFLRINNAQKNDAGNYICTATDPRTGTATDAPPARLYIKQPVIAPEIDPPDQTVDEGHPSRIRCWIPGNPDAQLRWSKQGRQPLPHGAQEQNGVLSIPRTMKIDEGYYVCTAFDPSTGSPVEAPPARIHVRQSARIQPEVDPVEQSVPEGDPFRIRCWVPGHANIPLTWRRANGQLSVDSDQQQGTLMVNRAQFSDAGDYICSAEDPVTHDRIDSGPATVHVTAPTRVSPITSLEEGPEVSPHEQTVPEGDPATIRCWVPGNTDAELSWKKVDGTPLPFGASEQGGVLSIPSTQSSDQGTYVCTYHPPGGARPKDSSPSILNIESHEQPPTARVEPRVWNGKPGDRHQFKCIVTGIPTPKVTWSGPNNTPLPHDVTELDGNILDFSNGRRELNGDYTCIATNPIGEASDHGSVNIGPSLTVKTTPAGTRLIYTVGEVVHIKCEAFGEPEPEVEWLHDPGPERGDLPDDFKPVTISEQFIHHPSIGLGNAGAYTCKGSNSHATATKNIYIEVVEPSRVATVSILGGSSQWFEQGEPSELICTATGSSLVDKLEWVKVDDQLPTDVEEHNEPGLLHFPNFKNSYAGEYECRGYRNNDLIATSTVNVHASTDETDDAKVEIEPPRIRVVSQGESIVLKCSVEDPRTRVLWWHTQNFTDTRSVGSNRYLHLQYVDVSDKGIYYCTDEHTNYDQAHSVTTLVVLQRSQFDAIVVKFDEKSDASFTCPIYSVPGSKVEWSRSDGDLPANAVPNGNKLEIKEFDDSASGLYVCKVTIDNNVVEGYVHAQIFVPDTIIQVLLEVSSESVSVGDRAWFDCKVTGDPSAVISWFKEGSDELPENSQVTNGRLLFTDVTDDNVGVYRCRAKTKAGPLETRAVLNIGSSKRKRKHVRGRHARKSQRRRAVPSHEKKLPQSLFGSWFSTY